MHLLYHLIGAFIGSVLWSVWIKFSESSQDLVMDLGGGFSAYVQIVLLGTLIGFSISAIISVSLRLAVNLYHLVREKFADSIAYLRHFCGFALLSCALGIYVRFFYVPDPNPENVNAYINEFALNNAEIIGASTALIFSFSIFALQRMADFLPSRHLIFLTKNSKESVFFVLLFFLIFISLFMPIFLLPDFPRWALWGLLTALLGSFFIIYLLYFGLSEKTHPDYSMKEIKNSVIKELKKARKQHEDLHKLDVKVNLFDPAYTQVKDLKEMGLKLFAKNEILSFNQFLTHIENIFVEHLKLGDGFFIKDNKNCNFHTEKFLILELSSCLLLMSGCVTRENREDLIDPLLDVYAVVLKGILNIKYVDEAKYDAVPNWILKDYQKLINQTFPFKNSVMNFTIVDTLLSLHEITTQKGKDYNPAFLNSLRESLREAEKHYIYREKEVSAAISELTKKLGFN